MFKLISLILNINLIFISRKIFIIYNLLNNAF